MSQKPTVSQRCQGIYWEGARKKSVRKGEKENIEEEESKVDFPGGAVDKNLLASAGDKGSILGFGTKIPRAVGRLSPRTTPTEPVR